MMTNDDLERIGWWKSARKCPFCGNGTKSLFLNICDDGKGWYISCEMSDYGCGATGPIGGPITDAVNYWNGKTE